MLIQYCSVVQDPGRVYGLYCTVDLRSWKMNFKKLLGLADLLLSVFLTPNPKIMQIKELTKSHATAPLKECHNWKFAFAHLHESVNILLSIPTVKFTQSRQF